MKRFYKQAEAGTAPGGYVVRLDGKLLKTPLKNNLIFASSDLADAIAAEWEAQQGELAPSKMPLTQLANTMTDKATGDDRAAMNAEILKYCGSDLVCYFATHPSDVVKRQEQQWLPLIDWMKEKYGVTFETVKGFQYKNQPPETLKKLETVIRDLDPVSFTVVQAVTGIAGSPVIAFAVLEGRLDAQSAYVAACVEEIYQLEKWGEDMLARRHLDHVLTELKAVETFLKLVRASP